MRKSQIHLLHDRKRIVTVPNALSAYRIAIAPVILCMILCGHRTAFAALVIACLVTDVFDGLIARRWHQETDLGTKLDSCADIPIIFYGMIVLSILNNIEELFVIGLLPEKRSKVRGLYWVLKDCRNRV